MFGRKKFTPSNDIYGRLEKEYSDNKARLATLSTDGKTACAYCGYALDAVDFSKKALNIDLDFSETSIGIVEGILDGLSKDIAKSKPTDVEIEGMAKMFAGYIGEVIRQADGSWLAEENTHAKNAGPAIVFAGGKEFYILNKVLKRLQNGAEDNVLLAYTVLRKR